MRVVVLDTEIGRIEVGAYPADCIVLAGESSTPCYLERGRLLRDAVAGLVKSPFAQVVTRRQLYKPYALHVSSVPEGTRSSVLGSGWKPPAGSSLVEVPAPLLRSWGAAIAGQLDATFSPERAQAALGDVAERDGWFDRSGFATIRRVDSAQKWMRPEHRAALLGECDAGGALTMRDLYLSLGAVPLDSCGRVLEEDAERDAHPVWCRPRFRVANTTVGSVAMLARVPAVVSEDRMLPTLHLAADHVETVDDVVCAERWRLETDDGTVVAPLGAFIPRHPVSMPFTPREKEIKLAGQTLETGSYLASPAPWPMEHLVAGFPELAEVPAEHPLLMVLPVRAADAMAFLETEPDVFDALAILSQRTLASMHGRETSEARANAVRRQAIHLASMALGCAPDTPEVATLVTTLTRLCRETPATGARVFDPAWRILNHLTQERARRAEEPGMPVGWGARSELSEAARNDDGIRPRIAEPPGEERRKEGGVHGRQ
ncbi:MAG: hypothetical protein C0497_04230 [Gemmatimonas sp.]|nr:hypothetical protein [Gemmatimonas sp.]